MIRSSTPVPDSTQNSQATSQVYSLVTGGGGFIGTHLVRLLLERGERVKVLELDGVSVLDGVEVIRGSVNDPDAVCQAVKGVHRVYHLAAYTDLWARDKSVFQRVNYDGTCVVLYEAARAQVEVVVHTSTESVLTGKADLDRSDDASIRRRLALMPGPYCRSKLLAEQAAFEAARNGLSVVVVSPTLPIGPGDWRVTPPTRMILNFLNQNIPAYLECNLNLVDVRDVAHGHFLAAQQGCSGERYLLGNENMTLGQLLPIIEDITGLMMPKRKIPYWLALMVGALQEFTANYLTHKPPMAPLTGVRLAGSMPKFDSNKAINELGFKQSPIKQALIEEIAWLVEMGYVKRLFPS